MPHSSTDFKLEIQNHLDKNFTRDLKILDVGPGAGMYGEMLSNYSNVLNYSLGFKLDCIEIHPPYIEKYNLRDVYENVFEGNICDFDFTHYDYIILGDILEHLNIKDAQKLIDKINDNNIKCMVAVPYLSEQGEYAGNIYERHLQEDLTPEIMGQRYPSLKLLYGNDGYGYYVNYNLKGMKEILVKEYNNLIKNPITPLIKSNTFKVNFIKGCRFEVIGDQKAKYSVNFINQENGDVVYESTITNNMWCQTNVQYFVNYLVKVTDVSTGEVVFEHKYNGKDQKIYVHLASNALGDTLSWVPHLEEFRKKHNCELVVSTFHNSMFEPRYPDIKFVSPGTEIFDLYAMYEVGWHYDEEGKINYSRNPENFRKNPLSKTASDILGLDYKEIKPKHTFKNTGPTIDGDYVCIAPHASAHAKYWNYKGGWQTVIDYLNDKGYKVVMITQEPLGDKWHDSKIGGTLKNVIDKTGDFPLSERANDLMNAKSFIGLGSGLSWLSWAVGCPTTLISGFSEAYSEFEDCQRISPPKDKCSGCFNITRLNAGDWEWCPEHKNTSRHFECTKSIHPETVINALNHQLEITP